jgi:hypothetical protein
MNVTYDESFLEESALQNIRRSINQFEQGQAKAYKLVIIDLDDGSLVPGRFMEEIEKIVGRSTSQI